MLFASLTETVIYYYSVRVLVLHAIDLISGKPPTLTPCNSVAYWSPYPDLNWGPLPYQGSALPLSYMGKTFLFIRLLPGAGDGNRTHVISLEG